MAWGDGKYTNFFSFFFLWLANNYGDVDTSRTEIQLEGNESENSY